MLRRVSLILILAACAAAACGDADDLGSEDAGGAGLPDGGTAPDAEDSSPLLDAGDDGARDSAAADGDADDAHAVDADAGDAGEDAGDASDGGAVPSDGGDAGDGGEGDAGGCTSPMAPEIVTPGTGTSLLLRGTIVTPDQVFAGEVLVVGDTITCVAAQCPGGDTVVDTHGLVFPGLIDTHNHILFDVFDETDWTPSMSYGNHNQWTNEARYGALVDAKQYLNGEGPSPVDFGCELDKYGELKGLVAGTTSIVGAANPANRACYGSLARTVDQSPNALGTDKVQVATLFPSTSSADGVCTNFTSSKTDAYLIHIGEGVDATALGELEKLRTVTTTDGCLFDPKTAIVHGAAFGDPELEILAQHQMSLVWSPRSNVFLYGGGTDLSRTANIPLALAKGINVALAPDWSIGGSQNLLDELRFAKSVDAALWGSALGAKQLVEMVTTRAAKVLGLDAVIGSIEVGKKADLMVIGGDACHPYDALLAATPVDVRLVLVGGKALYGDAALKPLGPSSPGCEDIDICGANKFACVASTSQRPTDKLDQTLSAIQTTLDSALSQYDALQLSPWTFSPITPLVRCP